MIGFLLLLGGALCAAVEVVLVVLSPNPLTIGCLVFSALMFAVNFSAWRAPR